MKKSAKNIVLALETVTGNGSLAFMRDGEIRACRVLAPEISLSAELISVIRATIQEWEISLTDLRAMVFVTGPGSFTGLRVGAATMRGFCKALHLPLYGIPTFAVLRQVLNVKKRSLCLFGGGRQKSFGQFIEPKEDNLLDSVKNFEYEELSYFIEKYPFEPLYLFRTQISPIENTNLRLITIKNGNNKFLEYDISNLFEDNSPLFEECRLNFAASVLSTFSVISDSGTSDETKSSLLGADLIYGRHGDYR